MVATTSIRLGFYIQLLCNREQCESTAEVIVLGRFSQCNQKEAVQTGIVLTNLVHFPLSETVNSDNSNCYSNTTVQNIAIVKSN